MLTLEGGVPLSKRHDLLSKKLHSSEVLMEKDIGTLGVVSALSTPSAPPLPELEEYSPQPPELSLTQTTIALRAMVDTIVMSSSDSHFLCFEGLPLDWEASCSWFYGMAVSSHIVWINQMYQTVSDSQPLIWLDLKSNEDACKLRGYLTHQTTPDQSLIISHFVSEAMFMEMVRNCTNKWV